MKHAFLIGAYIHPEYVDSLISSLRSQRSNVYIHVNKSYFNKFVHLMEKYKNCDDVYFVKPIKINYGGIGMLLTERELLREALKDSDNERFHLITGQDILVKPLNELFDFFDCADVREKEYLKYNNYPGGWDSKGKKFYIYRLHDLIDCRDNNRIHYIDSLFRDFQIAIGIRRREIPFSKIYYGSGWWSLSKKGASVLFEGLMNDSLINRMEYTFGPDELLPHCILLNNRDISVENENFRFVYWQKGCGSSPAYLSLNDVEIINKSKMFFARKVSPLINQDVINYYQNFVK